MVDHGLLFLCCVTIAAASSVIYPQSFIFELGKEESAIVNYPAALGNYVAVTKNGTRIYNFYQFQENQNLSKIVLHFIQVRALDCGEYLFWISKKKNFRQYITNNVTINCNNPPLFPLKYLYPIISGVVCFVTIVVSICCVVSNRSPKATYNKTATETKENNLSRSLQRIPAPQPTPMQAVNHNDHRLGVPTAHPDDVAPPVTIRSTSLVTSATMRGIQSNELENRNFSEIGEGHSYEDVPLPVPLSVPSRDRQPYGNNMYENNPLSKENQQYLQDQNHQHWQNQQKKHKNQQNQHYPNHQRMPHHQGWNEDFDDEFDA